MTRCQNVTVANNPRFAAMSRLALEATRESKKIDFKREFDTASRGAWCEIIKDIAAMANSGGGIIVVGINDDGGFSKFDATSLLSLDHAVLVDKVAKFTGEQFDDLAIIEAKKGRKKLPVLVVGPKTGSPLIFEKPGSYTNDDGKMVSAFAKGAVYFRHGAKSEPGLSRDIVRFAKEEETRNRRELLKNIRKAASAPMGSELIVATQVEGSLGIPGGFRVSDDPNSPVVGRTDHDDTHPYRLKELTKRVNELAGSNVASTYDIQCIRKMFSIRDEPRYYHQPKFTSAQYSEAFAEWLVTKYRDDSKFFTKAKVWSRTHK